MAPRHEPDTQTSLTDLILAPVYYLFNSAWSQTSRLLPYLLPLAAAMLFVPGLALLSLGAGYMVWNSVPVPWSEQLDFQYGEGTPYANAMLRSLVADQAYSVSLRLVVAASESNFALGNFMSTLALTTAANKTVAAVSKPSIVLPQRGWFTSPSTVTHTVEMLPNFIPYATRLLAHVEVGRKDGWRSIGNGQGRELSILSASLMGQVELSGLRALIATFPLTSSIVAAAAFFTLSLIGLIGFAAIVGCFRAGSQEVTARGRRLSATMSETWAEVEKRGNIMARPVFSDEDGSSTNSADRDTVLIKTEPDDGSVPVAGRRRRRDPSAGSGGSD